MIKKYKRLIVGFVSVALLGASALLAVNQPNVAQAQAVFKSNETVNQSDPVSGSFFGAGSTVQISDNIDGDVWAGGQTVTITGDINGDVIVAGQTVTISGKVSGDIRAMTQTLTVTGEVTGSVSALAQSLSITDSATIGRDMSFVSQSATIDGAVNRDVHGIVENLSVTGNVGRDVNYVSDRTLYRSADASIAGKISHTVAQSNQQAQPSKLTSLVMSLLITGFTVLVISLVAPRWVRSSTDTMFEQPWRVVVAGLVSLVIPIVAILSLISIVGALVGLALLLAYGLLIILGVVFTSYLIGRLIFRNTQPVAVQSFAGAVIYAILLFIPFVGFVAWVVGSVVGTGIIASDVAKRIASQRSTKKPAKTTAKKPTKEK